MDPLITVTTSGNFVWTKEAIETWARILNRKYDEKHGLPVKRKADLPSSSKKSPRKAAKRKGSDIQMPPTNTEKPNETAGP